MVTVEIDRVLLSVQCVGDRCAGRRLQLRWTEFYCLYSVLVTGVLGEDCSQEGKTVTVCTVFVTPMGVLRVDYSQDGQNRIVWCCKIVDKMDVVLLLLSCLWQVCSVLETTRETFTCMISQRLSSPHQLPLLLPWHHLGYVCSLWLGAQVFQQSHWVGGVQ